MTGVLNAMVGVSNAQPFSVTIANVGGTANLYGYNDSAVPPGSISPATFRGATVKVATSQSGGTGHSFNFCLSGVLAQSFFQYVSVQRTTGAWVIFRQQDVSSFVSGPTVTIWQWGGGVPDAVWTSTSPSPRQITIAF
jgi:hypothetical protein